MDQPKKLYTFGEELLNSISHGVGALLAIAGSAVLIVWAVFFSDAWGIVGASIYGFTLILLYTMSTLYHALTNDRAKKVFRALDHSTIYLLIAGTYTPYALVTIRGTMGWVVFGIVWGSAVVGITLNAISVERYKKISLALYLVSGWAAVIAMKPIVDNLATNGLLLMLLGGLFYTGGIVFYVMKKHKYFHGIWHFFVLAGSICHYFSILFYVVK
ncbi:MAG: hemolysin III family protein [Oscillospiraceae bacterium]